MTDQDNLRDRIAETMWSATISDGRCAAMVPDCKAMAQAIIDDLGLTIEQRDTGLQSNPPGRRIYVSRVVGDWDN